MDRPRTKSGSKADPAQIKVEDGTNNVREMERASANPLLYVALQAGKAVGWDWDIKSGRTCWFGDLRSMFGIHSSASIAHVEDFFRSVHPEDLAMVRKAVDCAMEDHSPYAAEFRVVRFDGAVRWIAAEGTFHYSSGSQAERMLGIAVDITDRKATAEENLHRKDRELAEAQRLAAVGSWQWDPATDTVLWSDELYRIVGRDRRLPAVSYKEHAQLYTPESWKRLRHAVEQALQTGAQYELDLEMIRADGATRWVIARGETQRDDTGRIIGLRGTLQDVHERRRAQQALQESEERLRLAAQAGRMYAFEWDRASDVIVRSAEFTHILGLSREPTETTCHQMMDSVHPDDRARVDAATRSCSPENPIYRVQYRVLREDGPVVWLEKNGYAFFDANGEMERTIGMIVDITERKLAEETLSSLGRRLIEAQETERARIARELHDDIGQRLALALITLDELKPASANSKSDFSRRLDGVRTQLRDIAKSVQNLSHELHSARLRHLGMIKAMRGFCSELSMQQKVEINFTEGDVPETVAQDVSLCLFRVLQEALHNAVKHSKVRHFDVEVHGTTEGVSLTVRDSGAGFKPDAAMGAGLGLISMQERLKLVNGTLHIDSQPKGGTTIHARVPLDRKNSGTVASGA
jgi:PAS domain S-box-containing protein